MLIFLIEKNTMIRDLLKDYLKKFHFEVYTITEIKDVKYLMEDLKPSLIVMDLETLPPESDVFKSLPMAHIPLITLGKVPSTLKVQQHFNKPLDPMILKDYLIKNFSN